jgi:sporulation protein YlmC with PRC-barrel domain
MQAFQPKLEKAKDLIGINIINDRGETLGTVHDIVLTPQRDAISYLVLSHGGVLGIGDKLFAVPWSQFQVRAAGEEGEEKALVLRNVSKADLDNAPGFDKNHWPATASANWLGSAVGRDVDEGRNVGEARSGTAATPGSPTYREPVASTPPAANRGEYGEYREGQAPGMRSETGYGAETRVVDINHRRLSKLFGMTIRSHQDEDLGKLDNAMIDVNKGQVAFGIVAIRSGFLGMNKDLAAVPWSALDFAREPGIARLDVDKETLTAIAFDEDSFPNLADPQYSRQLYERFHATPYWESLGYVPGEERPDRDMPPRMGTPSPNSDEYKEHKEHKGHMNNAKPDHSHVD